MNLDITPELPEDEADIVYEQCPECEGYLHMYPDDGGCGCESMYTHDMNEYFRAVADNLKAF